MFSLQRESGWTAEYPSVSNPEELKALIISIRIMLKKYRGGKALLS